MIRDESSNVDPSGWAVFSDCRTYRYELGRIDTDPLAGPRDRTCLFVMLNPSTADALALDPTVRRCLGFARSWGYGRLLVGNLFALRSTDPSALYDHQEPVGYDNDRALLFLAAQADLTVCAWGTHGALQSRGRAVRRMLESHRHDLYHLSLTQAGHPRHPLYLRGDLQPQRWTQP